MPGWNPALRGPRELNVVSGAAAIYGNNPRLVAEEVSEARAIAGQGLVGDYLFGEDHGLNPIPGETCVLFASMENWVALGQRLASMDILQPSHMKLPRHVLTSGIEWSTVGESPFLLGEALFEPLLREESEALLARMDAQMRLPPWEAWGIFPGLAARVVRTGWLRSDRPVFCGCAAPGA